MRYSAFISYNHRDRAWAAWLHRELEHYRLPSALVGRDSPLGPLERKLPPVFQDREELAASTNLAASVRQALEEAYSLIVICSSNGAQSHWVNEEVREFARLGRADRIQCLIVPEFGDPNGPSRPAAEVFPPALLELAGEPLAADARKSGDGKRSAFLKLVAGVIGVRYDDLRQREQARRHRRLMALASAASVGFLIMAGLTVFAFLSRAEAVRERDIARQKTMTAQRTTDFVKGLFEVSDPSEAKGRSITALEVLDQGARELQGQLSGEPDVKAELISTLSEVYLGLGSLRRADGLIRSSLSLKVSQPETRARQLGVLGASQTLQGDYDQAAKSFSQALGLLPQPEYLQDQTLYGRLLIGKAEALIGGEHEDQAMPLVRAAAAWDRVHGGVRTPNMARDYETAGLAAQLSGDLAGSRDFYSKALAIRLATQGRLHPKVSEDLNNLGSVAYLAKDLPSAERYWSHAVPIATELLGPNHPDLAALTNNLARALVEQRKFKQAIPLLTRSANIYLAQRSDTHDDLAFIFSNLALAKEGTGQTAEATELLDRAFRAAQVHNNRNLAPIMAEQADLRCAAGDRAGALLLLDQAGQIMKAQYPNDPWRSAWVDNTRGSCLLRNGDHNGARQLLSASSPIILKRWPPTTLYGFRVEQRLRELTRAR